MEQAVESVLGSCTLQNGCTLKIIAGSLLDFSGDAIVNAANSGGVTGFGIDEMVNRAAGDTDIKAARRAFGGIATGDAKATPSFQHTRVKLIIHAVGPVYRENAFRKAAVDELDALLESAYAAALLRAHEHECSTIGFCLLSAGVFRGNRALDAVITICLRAIATHCRPPLKEISVFAFSLEEQDCARAVFPAFQASLKSEQT